MSAHEECVGSPNGAAIDQTDQQTTLWEQTAQRTSMMSSKPRGGTFSVLILAQAAARMQLHAMMSPTQFPKIIKNLSRSVYSIYQHGSSLSTCIDNFSSMSSVHTLRPHHIHTTNIQAQARTHARCTFQCLIFQKRRTRTCQPPKFPHPGQPTQCALGLSKGGPMMVFQSSMRYWTP